MKVWMWLGTLLFAALLFLQVPQTTHAETDTYIVKSGDTLWKISKKYKIGLSEIINANSQFSNPDLIYPGDRVTIPLKSDIKSVESQVIDLTNQERAKNGLPALKANWQLSRVARYKSRDMANKGYFSHNSPTYGSPFEMMRNFNVSYNRAAENIAAGQRTPQEVVNGWMNSPGHRKNILDPNLRQIGVGYAQGGSYGHYWTQMFISQ
ncbi:SafA/ExsA family spore coat assembly protein [Halobacillus litoralis]|uniref:SafA/ExsA family spore coat assembly protein n=1 Tax=Halobacillus litoralis TaxID=45668 RepID=UPI001CFF3014|nr:SafA/ExsA family spore coat assembly protein [Halobacillus litoralis]